jgi:hypothetical protein
VRGCGVSGGLPAWSPTTFCGAHSAARPPTDAGSNRILVLTPSRHVVFRFPNSADLAAGRKLFYNDDTLVEPGGQALIANEEDNHAIVEVGVADHSPRVLFGHPGRIGSDATHLKSPTTPTGIAV